MVGSTLSHYRIKDELGRGGMGIVYRAEDNNLDRKVAIKVLPSAALASVEDRARFYREAKAAAKLHHPHIASIFEIDEAVPGDAPGGTEPTPFIAMEFIDGASLSGRITRGPLELDEAVRIAIQIAQALEAAHEEDIVHRDIKPQNVMLTSRGDAKVLDFGLALTAASTKLTRMGSTLGTVAYMSPEQARGEEVDARADIWALGVTLYEMIAGRHPFGGDYEQAVVYSILNEHPEPLTAVRTGVPMGLEWIVDKMIAKNAKDRYQNAADLLVDLRNVDLTATGMSRISTSSISPRREVTHANAILSLLKRHALPVLITAVAVHAITRWTNRQDLSPTSSPLETLVVEGVLQLEDIDISRDGTRIAFQGIDRDGRGGIFEREWIPGGQLYYFEGSELGTQPAYSPDGRRITYRSRPLRIHSVEGGAAQEVPNTEHLLGGIPVWVDNDHILMADEVGAIVTINISNGSRRVLARPDSGHGHRALLPSHLNKSGRLLAVNILPLEAEAVRSIGIVDLEKGRVHELRKGASYPSFVSEDIITYTLHDKNHTDYPGLQMVHRISRDRSRLEGSPVPIPSGSEKSGYAYTVREGDFIIWTNNSSDFTTQHLYRQALDSGGRRERIKIVNRGGWPSLSPDGSRLARVLSPIRGSDFGPEIEMLEPATGSSHIAFRGDSIRTFRAIWGREGGSLYFSQARNGQLSLYKVATDFSSEPTEVLPDAVPLGISPDGKYLAFGGETWEEGQRIERGGLGLYDLQTGAISTLKDSIGVLFASFSSNSEYLAIGAFERDGWRIQVKPVRGGVWQEVDSGAEPLWSPNDDFLYYHSTGDLRRTNRRKVTWTPVPAFGDREELFSVWFSGGVAFDFDQNLSYYFSAVHIEPDQDATISRINNFPEFARQLMHGGE